MHVGNDWSSQVSSNSPGKSIGLMFNLWPFIVRPGNGNNVKPHHRFLQPVFTNEFPGCLANPSLLGPGYRQRRTSRASRPASFDLNDDQGLIVNGYQVQFPTTELDVAVNDLVATPAQVTSSQFFTPAAKHSGARKDTEEISQPGQPTERTESLFIVQGIEPATSTNDTNRPLSRP